jgi:hypothetical protein
MAAAGYAAPASTVVGSGSMRAVSVRRPDPGRRRAGTGEGRRRLVSHRQEAGPHLVADRAVFSERRETGGRRRGNGEVSFPVPGR